MGLKVHYLSASELKKMQNESLDMSAENLEIYVSSLISKSLQDKIHTEDTSIIVNTNKRMNIVSSPVFLKIKTDLEEAGYKANLIKNNYYLISYLIEW